MSANHTEFMERKLPKFEPRIPEFLLDKMNPMEREMFSRLDVNSQQTEHTLRVVLQAHEERAKVVSSVQSMQQAHAEHCAQDKKDFGDLRDKHAAMSSDVSRCAATLDGWSAKATAVGKVFNFFFGRKGLLTAAMFALVTWGVVEYAKAHFAAARGVPSPPPFTQK